MKVTLNNVIAPGGKEILVVVPFGWGRARTLKDAYQKAKREVGGKDAPLLYAAVVSPEDYVNGMGGVVYKEEEPPKPLISFMSVEVTDG